jgi:adenylate cyclase
MLSLSMQEIPSWAPCHRFLASCYAHLGRLADAHSVVEKLRHITPVPVQGAEHWRIREDRDYYLEGLHLAIGKVGKDGFR